MVAAAALVTWAANAALGMTMLLRWPRPPGTAYVHLATAGVGLVGWVGYLALGRPGWLAWMAFAWLVVVNTLGDLLLVGGWRGRTRRPSARGAGAYVAAVGDVLSFRRPVAAAHAVGAGATFALVLLAALGV